MNIIVKNRTLTIDYISLNKGKSQGPISQVLNSLGKSSMIL
jgi:hypothetical protein